MLRVARAGLAVALLTLAWVLAPANAAEKSFKQSALDEAAIKLEAQIKSDAGAVAKPAATLRRDADTAFQKNEFRSGMVVLSQLVTVAPDDASSWLRLARTILQIKPRDDREKALLFDRASTAAYIAYQRAGDRNLEADSLSVLGRTLSDRQQWRGALDSLRLSLELRETAELRGQYEKLRAEHGFRLLDFTVDSDSIAPRACFQFSEELPGRRTDFSPFVAVAGVDRPATSAGEKQLCVEGLKHGERYSITLRAGLPSVVKETLAKSAEFTIFVRDRKPFARFSGKAYVLPRTGQRGIPVLSVNTKAVALSIYRIGDRNLIDTLLGYDFQRNLSRYQAERLANERGARIWSGELAVEPKLNTEVTTAFPLDEAVKDLGPGVYAITAEPKDVVSSDYGQQATQWFIVSDLGLTAYTAHDGIDVFIHSLASADPRSSVEVRLVARNNEVLAVRQTDRNGFIHFEAGLARGEGGAAPAAIVASEKNDYAFLSLKSPAFDLSDRGVAGRPVPTGLDAFVYTERGVYRTGETVAVTALLRDVRGVAAPNVPLTLVIARPDGVEYRRALVPDQGLGGRSMSVPIVASASTGTWRVAAYTDPKRPPVGETTFMVEDYVPDRIEFDLASSAKGITRTAPAQLRVEGHFLYGAPASNLELSGQVSIAAARELPGFPIDPTIFERYVPAAPMGDVVPIQPTVRTDGVIKPVDELDVDRTKDAVVPTGETIVPGVGDPNAKAGPVTGTGSGTGVVDTVEPKPDDFIFTEELPQAVLKVVPEYPAIARQAGMEGDVLVRMLVGTDGRVLRAEIQKGSALFDEEALKAARQWTFTPALTDGKPVMVWVRVPFNFRLH